MTFHSILFARTEGSIQNETLEAPSFFVDVNLDQIIDTITADKQEYHLQPFFYTPLHDIDAITYRHEVMRDLENTILLEYIQAFAQTMRKMRQRLAQAEKLYYTYQKERWFVDAVELYCEAVPRLVQDVSLVDVQSRGFLAFREYIANYVNSSRFTALLAETKKLKAALATVKYCLLIKGNRIKVRKYEDGVDYSVEVEAIFARFKQGAVKDYKVKFQMGHIHRRIDFVQRENRQHGQHSRSRKSGGAHL